MNRLDVIGFGALDVDYISKSDSITNREMSVADFIMQAGGSAGNTLCGLSRLGLRCGAVGRVGIDTNAHQLIESFHDYKVDFSQVSIDRKNHTGYSSIYVDKSGIRTMLSKPGCNGSLDKQHIHKEYLQKAAWLHYGDFLDEKQFALQLWTAKQITGNVKTSFRLDSHILEMGYTHFRKILPYIDLVIIKDYTLKQLTKAEDTEGADRMIFDGANAVAIIHSAATSTIVGKDESYAITTSPVQVQDESGISCAYTAGFIFGQLTNRSLKRSALLGNAMMSFCAEQLGCRSNLPTIQELLKRSKSLQKKVTRKISKSKRNRLHLHSTTIDINRTKITYADVGDNYDTKDPAKIIAQEAARQTSENLATHGFSEVSETRGESAYVFRKGSLFMAAVTEGLGTKSLIADAMRKITGKTYYDVIGHDTVATIINDLITVGAKPLVIHAYWAIEDNSWLQDGDRLSDLISGWKAACNLAGVSWGGGETATMKDIVLPETCELGGSATGIVEQHDHLILDKKLTDGDSIILIKSNGVNANGISLTRAIAKQLTEGYAARLPSGILYGEALLTKSNIYAKLVHDLLSTGIDIHYLSNITGHGLRKIMRARQNFTYIIEKLFDPQEVFLFIQKHAQLSDKEMYDTYNMGMDYALYLPKKDVSLAQKIIMQNNFESIEAGHIENGKRQVVIEPKSIVFEGDSLQLRIY